MSKTKVPKAKPEKQTESDSGVDVAERPQVSTPRMFAVVLLNDDYTPMDFVILVLRRFFGHNEEAAQKIMLDVHRQGSGTAGVFTLEIAEMKSMQVNQFAKMNQHPLKSTLREVS